MSGQYNSVQVKIKEFVPHATYVHCLAHNLNLVLVDSVKSLPSATKFFVLLKTLYVFISFSKVHIIYMERQKNSSYFNLIDNH